MKELKKCPFCGKKDLSFFEDEDENIHVVCNSCDSCGSGVSIGFDEESYEDAKQEAIKLWNRRSF